MVRVKTAYTDEHSSIAAVTTISSPCRVHKIYTIMKNNSGDEQSLELYDEKLDGPLTGVGPLVSFSSKPSVILRVPKDAVFGFCRNFNVGFGVSLFDMHIGLEIDGYNSPSGVTWTAPRGGIVFDKGVSLSSSGAGLISTTIIYSDRGRQKQGALGDDRI